MEQKEDKKYNLHTLRKAWGAGYNKVNQENNLPLGYFLEYFEEIIHPINESIRKDLDNVDPPISDGLGFVPRSVDYIIGFWAAREKWPKSINEKFEALLTLFEIKKMIETKEL